MDKKELIRQAMQIKPFMNIGKQGISPQTIEQIKNHLKANKLTKIKLLRTFLDNGNDKKEIAKQLAQDTNSELIKLIGLTVILYKR